MRNGDITTNRSVTEKEAETYPFQISMHDVERVQKRQTVTDIEQLDPCQFEPNSFSAFTHQLQSASFRVFPNVVSHASVWHPLGHHGKRRRCL